MEIILPSKYLFYDHVVHIYLPAGYEKSNKKYPVVYFQDGKDYIEFAVVPHILDNLIEEKEIEPPSLLPFDVMEDHIVFNYKTIKIFYLYVHTSKVRRNSVGVMKIISYRGDYII